MVTRRACTFFLTAVSLYIIALVNQLPNVYAMFWVVAVTIVVCLLLSRMSLSGLDCTDDTTPVRGFEGRPLHLQLRLTNRGSFRKTNLLIEKRLENRTQAERESFQWFVPAIGGRDSVRGETQWEGLKRGIQRVLPLVATGTDPLGLFLCRRSLSGEGELVVYPEVDFGVRVRGSTLHSDATLGPTRGKKPGRGTEFLGVRPYEDGDDLRWVHWATTARTGRLAVKQMEERARFSLCIVADLPHRLADKEALELELKIAASIAFRETQRGTILGLRVTADHFRRQISVFPPSRGERHLHRMLYALAIAELPGDPQVGETRLTFDTEPAALLALTWELSGSTVAFARALRARGQEVAFVVIARDSDFAGTEQRVWRTRLVSLGSHLLVVPPDTPLRQAMLLLETAWHPLRPEVRTHVALGQAELLNSAL